MAKKQICIVIGASHGGVNFAFNLRKKGWKGEIILYDAESVFPYQKPPLSKSYLINGNLEHNFIKPPEAFKKENIFLERIYKNNLDEITHVIVSPGVNDCNDLLKLFKKTISPSSRILIYM